MARRDADPFDKINFHLSAAMGTILKEQLLADSILFARRFFNGDQAPKGAELTAFLADRLNRVERSTWQGFPRKYEQYIQSAIDGGEIASGRVHAPGRLSLDVLKLNYSFAMYEVVSGLLGDGLPTFEGVHGIAEFKLPMLEVCAGAGLYGQYLKPHVPIYIGTDNQEEARPTHFTDITKADGREAFTIMQASFNQLGVLMCYPPTQAYTETTRGKLGSTGERIEGYSRNRYDMPTDVAMRMRKGDMLFYVGKYRGHEVAGALVTASPKFHDTLDAEFEHIETIQVCRWPYGADPDLMIFRKRTEPVNG